MRANMHVATCWLSCNFQQGWKEIGLRTLSCAHPLYALWCGVCMTVLTCKLTRIPCAHFLSAEQHETNARWTQRFRKSNPRWPECCSEQYSIISTGLVCNRAPMYRSLFQKRPAIFIEPAKRSYPIYIHSYMHTYIYTNIHTYIHTNKLTYIHTYTHTYIHMYIQIYIPTHKHTHWVSKTYRMSQMEGGKEREKQILQVVLTHNELSLSLSLSLFKSSAFPRCHSTWHGLLLSRVFSRVAPSLLVLRMPTIRLRGGED